MFLTQWIKKSLEKAIFVLWYFFSKIGKEVEEGQPQEDTDDAAIALGEGESYFQYKAQKYLLIN